MVTVNCGHCGAVIEGRGRYCGPACKQAAYRARHGAGAVSPSERAVKAAVTRAAKVITKTCPICGAAFGVNGNAAAAVYCSDACKQAAYRARRADSALATLAPYMVNGPEFDTRRAGGAVLVAWAYSAGHWALPHDDYRVVTAEELADLVAASPGGWVIEKHD